jgi:two-component system, NtrC family, response regulator GlrR
MHSEIGKTRGAPVGADSGTPGVSSEGGATCEWGGRAHLLGNSPAFLRAVEIARKLSTCDVVALVQGETGTGKELVARAMHYGGARTSGPFVPVNCGALPDNLVESELFGHVRGAYTDAREDRAGLIAQAEGGTLFLDEVEAMSVATQVKLLRFLQDSQYRPVGGRSLRTANVRMITATNVDLRTLVDKGVWREDLLFRLQVVPFVLPPLRERGQDVLLLARNFISVFAKRYGVPERELHPDTVGAMLEYSWPGNVRELENLIHRQFLLERGPLIEFSAHAAAAEPVAEERSTALTDRSFREAKAGAIAQFERAYLAELLARARGNISAAARMCGKERRDLGRLIRRHGLEAESRESSSIFR